MKYIADWLRYIFPGLNDTQIHRILIFLHSLVLYVPLILFLFVKDFLFRLIILYFLALVSLVRLVYKECPLKALEFEFVQDKSLNILEIMYDLWGWEPRSRKEQVIAFTSFNIGMFASMLALTLIG